MQHGALEAVFIDGAFELVGGGRRIGRRQRREAGKAVGLGGDEGGEPIVDAPADLDRDVGLDHLQRGRAV